MKVKKRNEETITFDTEKIVKAISKAIYEAENDDIYTIDDDIVVMITETIEKMLLDENIQVGDNVKAHVINIITRFYRSKFLKNYFLIINKLYDIRLKIINKENMRKLLRFIIKQVGEIGLKEIIKMMVIQLIESVMNRRELRETPYYYV